MISLRNHIGGMSLLVASILLFGYAFETENIYVLFAGLVGCIWGFVITRSIK